MAPSWNFEHLALAAPASHGVITPTSTPDVFITHSNLQITAYNPCATSHVRLNILGLPSEVRDAIWQTIFDDITVSAGRSEWARRPSTEYGGLSLTCRQIRDEIAFFWPRTIIQHNRITTFIHPTIPTVQDFKRLALEIPLNQKSQFFLAAAASLRRLAPVLQDLRIFFVGSDKFQVALRLDACGLHEADVNFISKRLAIDGQNHSIRQPLFVALRSLSNLRTLVLSNPNYPIFPKMVLEHKSRLRQLHLVADARTTVHRQHDLKAGGLNPIMIRPVQHSFPPVSVFYCHILHQKIIAGIPYTRARWPLWSVLKYSQVEILNISANASLNSLQLAGACTLDLRHLTWTVPDLSLQSAGGVRVNWYRDTANLLHVLRSNSKQLQTLRMCFHEAIYEADAAAGTLVAAFRHHLEHLPIEILELHVNSMSPWFGREIIQYLPCSLRRLYISRELLDEQHLTLDVDSRYMACQSTNDSKTASRFVRRLQGDAQDDYIQEGEDQRRNDFISLGGGKLGFIGYEYEPTKPTRFGNSQIRRVKDEETRTWLLMLNGRLLDRERNLHLAEYDGAKHIAPRQNASEDFLEPTTENYRIAGKHGPLWVYAPASLKEAEAAASELKDSIIVESSHYYFGSEEGAAAVFRNEPGVHPDDVLEHLWPDEVSAHAEEHWQTDNQAGGRSESETEETEAERSVSKKARNIGHSAWEEERITYWVRYWTWYPRNSSYINEDERERFLAERSGRSLKSLENDKVVEEDLQG